MAGEIIFRLYRSSDRKAIRLICSDTADKGEPIESFFGDRQAAADLLTGYYTDDEPGSLWVAEFQGEVIGYLSGCLDTAKYLKVMKNLLLPRILLRSLFRGVFFRKDTWRILGCFFKTARMGGLKRNVPLEKFPAHLHLNVRNGFRGKKVGTGLIQHFMRQVKQAGVQGIHLSTREDNPNACKFFQSQGFKELRRYPGIDPNSKQGKMVYTLIYGKEVI